MRTAGVVLLVIGILIAYLGWTGKLGSAWQALLTGKSSQGSPTAAPDPTTTAVTRAVNTPPTEPGGTISWNGVK